MIKSTVLTILLITLSTVAAGVGADAYICRHHEAVREIEVVYDSPGQTVPCRVVYRKAEGERTLWSASAQTGYCEEKAQTFVDKQRGWGWSCELAVEDDAPEDASSEALSDDTDETMAEPEDS